MRTTAADRSQNATQTTTTTTTEEVGQATPLFFFLFPLLVAHKASFSRGQ
jgi:hypothetical protein